MAADRISASLHQVELLIENLQRLPAIWDTSSPFYSNRSAKTAAWNDLSNSVGIPLADVKRTYETIRKRFRDDYNARYCLPSGSGAPSKKPYQHFDKLSFLLPTIKKRTGISNLAESEKNNESSSSCSSATPPPPSETIVTSSPAPTPQMPSQNTPNRKLKRKSDEDETSMVALKQKAMEILTKPKDDVHLWAMALAEDVRLVNNLVTRKRLMHRLSGNVLEAIEAQAIQTQGTPINTQQAPPTQEPDHNRPSFQELMQLY